VIEKEREREKMNKKKWTERETKRKEEEDDANRRAYPLSPDRTALETHYSRSKKIRNKIYKFLVVMSATGETFADRADLANQAANESKCSYETATRWINQYCSKNGDFILYDDDQRIQYRGEIKK